MDEMKTLASAAALPRVPALDRAAEAGLRARLDGKAKPPGSLGRIEDLAVALALIQGRADPRADRALLMVFAGDHGLAEEGVSPYPASVTAAMVATFLAGRASANAFARVAGADLRVVDAGVDAELAPHPALTDAKIRRGARNAAREAALTPAEVEAALSRGAALAARAAADRYDVIIFGEMGIGNTASAALLMHRLAPAPLRDCVGRGAGHDDAGLARKLATLQRAAARSQAAAPLHVLSEFGGCEIAMMTGAMLGAAVARRPVLVDGFICTAAALAAVRIDPAVCDYLLFAHASAESGHRLMLQALDARPLLDLSLRLGEGTGGLLALPLLRAAAALMNEVASLEDVLRGGL